MSSFAPSVLDNLRLTHDVVAAIRAIGEGKGKQDLFKERAPEVLENLRQVAIIESTESSNRLEGVTLPRTAIELLVRRNAEPQVGNRSEGEIAGYRNVPAGSRLSAEAAARAGGRSRCPETREEGNDSLFITPFQALLPAFLCVERWGRSSSTSAVEGAGIMLRWVRSRLSDLNEIRPLSPSLPPDSALTFDLLVNARLDMSAVRLRLGTTAEGHR